LPHEPQLLRSVSAKHSPLPAGHCCVVAPPHCTEQVPKPPSATVQMGLPEPTVGCGHTRHDEPQVVGLAGFTQAPPQACDVGALHARPQAGPPSAPGLHAATPPSALVGPGQTLLQVPQLFGSVAVLVHAPLQLSGVLPEHPTPHWPAVHVAVPPVPASQTWPHEPQLAGSVGSSQVVPHNSDVGATHPASPACTTSPEESPTAASPPSCFGMAPSPVLPSPPSSPDEQS